ncbi:hypothetical protein EMIHUDRAFT_234947 [Emiliania huxleyi CCMP1516]|uniref:Uncharacterized protein n=2 Tax=Emiliania huxleyi TaxID=2903 RepID=A0A0D3JXG2_EMIH1|nr:hypothetical protein EMIHUDRAFT_234947 [Emiliania huxleyi CCMP1516]EOD28197.1 hypothetical protein EMIHUDRAFT_234947 [Emiliania huxleyi CCMP1516]|eukprot:XP_005780626.1 hypothetical protein EMIHUDRAFT_234947 [Emiliania huxleyi CCMP1516]
MPDSPSQVGLDGLDRLSALALLGESDVACSSDAPSDVRRLWHLMARGAFDCVLREPLAHSLLGEVDEKQALDVDACASRVRAHLRSHPTAAAAAAVTWIGASALCRFVQLNWTSTRLWPAHSLAENGAPALAALQADGEDVYVMLRSPALLLAARALLLAPLPQLREAAAGEAGEAAPASRAGLVAGACDWWAARTAAVHQRCLVGSATAPTLSARRALLPATGQVGDPSGDVG